MDVWTRELSATYDARPFEFVAALAGEDTGPALLPTESAGLLDILVDVRDRPAGRRR